MPRSTVSKPILSSEGYLFADECSPSTEGSTNICTGRLAANGVVLLDRLARATIEVMEMTLKRLAMMGSAMTLV